MKGMKGDMNKLNTWSEQQNNSRWGKDHGALRWDEKTRKKQMIGKSLKEKNNWYKRHKRKKKLADSLNEK